MRGLLFVLLLAVGTCGVIAAAPRFKKAPPFPFKPAKHVVVEPIHPSGGSAGQRGELVD